jgi:hypothetical protein
MRLRLFLRHYLFRRDHLHYQDYQLYQHYLCRQHYLRYPVIRHLHSQPELMLLNQRRLRRQFQDFPKRQYYRLLQ